MITRWVGNDVRAWVEMPSHYAAADVTLHDCQQDEQLRFVARPPDLLRGDDAVEFARQTGIAVDEVDADGVAWLRVPAGQP
jgi:hypothetical protein